MAERQFWTIARRQMRAVGFGSSRIESWVRMERLHARYPGIYAWGRPDLAVEGDLAAGLLYGGAGSALGGISALWWLELLGRRPELIHLDAPGAASSRQDLLLRHPRELDRNWHRGLPIVALPQALLAATQDLGHNTLRLVLARAEFKGYLRLHSLHAALGRGRAGSSALRAAMDAHLPQLARCANRFERDFVLLCESFGIEIPDPNERIGPYRPDMLWRAQRLVVELDGEDAHHTPAQLAADERRQRHLESLGYKVIRFTWSEVQFSPASVAARVAAHLRRP